MSAARVGVVGIGYWKGAVCDVSLGGIVAAMLHVIAVAGIDHVGLGSDYDGVGIMPLQLDDVSGYPYITQELLNRGYSPHNVRKVLGENLLRVLRKAESRRARPSAANSE